jgi:hypothetical protein
MAVRNYGVLKCRPVSTFLERENDSPHFQIHGRDDADVNSIIVILSVLAVVMPILHVIMVR